MAAVFQSICGILSWQLWSEPKQPRSYQLVWCCYPGVGVAMRGSYSTSTLPCLYWVSRRALFLAAPCAAVALTVFFQSIVETWLPIVLFCQRHYPFIASLLFFSLPFSFLLFCFSCLLSCVQLQNELRDCCARIYIFVSDRSENIYHHSYLIKKMNVYIVL